MSKKMERREVFLIGFCCLIYFCNYFCRYNFAAALAPMIEGLGTDKTAISWAFTGNAITYGVGQVLCGVIGDRISPRYFITAGLLGSALCNLFLFFTNSVPTVWVLWSINGLLQAMIWPALMRVMTEHLSPRGFAIAAPGVSYACSLSTFVVYIALLPFCLKLLTWRYAFLIPAVCTAIVAVAWLLLWKLLTTKSSPKEALQTESISAEPKAESGFFKAVLRAGLPVVFLCVMLQGILRDGIGEWMPSFILETYPMDASGAIMTAAILPAFSILCIFVTTNIYRKIKNEQLSSLIFWSVSTVSALLLFLFYQSSAVCAIIFMAFLNGSMHGINHLLTSRVSPYFAKYNRVSTVTGVINCFTYIGSAVAAPLTAFLSDTFEWRAVILMWLIVAGGGFLATLLHTKRYTRFIKASRKD